VNLVPAGPALLAGLALFALPGLLLLALLRRPDADELRFDESLFLLVASSVAASAWVGLVLAEIGLFSLPRAAAVLAAVCGAAALVARRRLSWPFRRPRGAADWAPAALLLGLAFSLQARPTEYLFGGRDPGTYVAAMALVGRTGGIAYADPAVLSIPPEDVGLFFRQPEGRDFSWGRFMGFPLERPDTGRVVPEFFHLFPAFGAFLFQAMGVKGALAAPPVFGILGTLGAFLVFRRLFGGPAALMGALLLAVNVVQTWFARYPVSEPMSQFLLFLGLLAVRLWEFRGSAVPGALAGFSFGLGLLVRIDGVLVLPALGLYLLVRRAHRDLSLRQAAAFAVPLVLLGAHAAFHAAFFARKYLLSITERPYWKQPPAAWALAAALVAAGAWALHVFGPRLVRALEEHRERLRAAAMALVLVLAGYAYFVRPALSAWAGGDGNDPLRARTNFAALDADGSGRLTEEEFARRGGAESFAGMDRSGDGLLSREEWRGDPPALLRSFRRLAAHDAQAFFRLGWFVTPLGLWLGVLGLLVLLRRFEARHLLPVLLLAASALFYFYKIRVYNDYYFALRRFVPVVLPLLLGLAAFFLARLAARGGVPRLLAGALFAGLLLSFGHATRPLLGHRDWRHAVAFVEDVARRFGPEDVVVFEQAQSIHLLSLPLWAVHGVNVLELGRFRPDPDRLAHLVEAFRRRYRHTYFVYTYRSNTDLCGLFLERVQTFSFGTHEWERAYSRAPRGPEFRALHFTLARVVPPAELRVPPLPEVDVGGTDDLLVSGFYDKEGGGDLTYRWTGPCSTVYLPGARPGASIEVVASVGREHAGIRPADVRASWNGRELGRFVVDGDWRAHVLGLPDPLPAGPRVLRLDVAAFRPSRVVPGSRDERDLGIMVDRLRVGAPPP
jgi:4-amino-4-deoxy-L-arabinose transferase-like glycosyltransferase